MIIGSQCSVCARYYAKKSHEQGVSMCEAFPAGIPDAIFFNEANHKVPYPGDNGLQFVPKPDESPDETAAFDALISS